MLIMATNKVNAEDLNNLNTPAPTVSELRPSMSHTPIPHATLVSYTRKALDRAGFEITEEEHGLSRNNNRYFGGFALKGNDMNDESRNLVLGLRNAHDKTLAAGICLGNQMIVCENLCFSSDIKLARKHTARILEDLPRVIATAISRVKSHWNDMGQRINAYQETEITRPQASDLLIDLVDAKALPKRKWYDIVKEFEAPRHAEFKGDNLWNLYNACTEHLKGSLDLLPDRTMQMQSLFDRVANHKPQIADVENSVVLSS